MTTHLSPHFTLEEFTDSQTAARQGINNKPPPGSADYAAIQRTAETIEKVRTILGNKPILVSSGYRSPQLNAAVGGSTGSAHMSGLACDFSCPGFGDALAICKALQPHLQELRVDQLIWEYGTWVHLGLSRGDPRMMCLTIDNNGIRMGFA